MVKVVAGLFALQQAGCAGRKSFQFADAWVDPLDDRSWVQSVGEFREDRLADGIGVHGLSENLQGEDVAVAVNDQPGEEIGFAENYAIGFGVVDQRLAIGDSIGDALAKQRLENPLPDRKKACGSRFARNSSRERCRETCRDGR